MSRKIALGAASAAAALTLAVALAAAGFAPGSPTTPASSVTIVDQVVTDPVAADPAPTVQVDTIYLAPEPKPQTITVQNVVRTSGGEDESEQESENDG